MSETEGDSTSPFDNPLARDTFETETEDAEEERGERASGCRRTVLKKRSTSERTMESLALMDGCKQRKRKPMRRHRRRLRGRLRGKQSLRLH